MIEPLMVRLLYMEDNVELEWHQSERKLQEYLLSTCGPDLRFEMSDDINGTISTVMVTKSGDFHLTKENVNDETIKIYIKPRSRLTIIEGGKVNVSAIVDIDARKLAKERMEKVKQAIAGV